MKPDFILDMQIQGILGQFIKFTGVGAIGTAGHYSVLILLMQTTNIKAVYASSCGLVAGAIINYLLNYYYTFDSSKQHSETMLKFALVAILGFAINGTIMFIGTNSIALHYIVAQLIATGIVLISNFTLNRIWTFSPNNK